MDKDFFSSRSNGESTHRQQKQYRAPEVANLVPLANNTFILDLKCHQFPLVSYLKRERCSNNQQYSCNTHVCYPTNLEDVILFL